MFEDEREIELSAISAIFPELELDSLDPFSAAIDLPVAPSFPVSVSFPESSDGAPVSANLAEIQVHPVLAANELHVLSHLPSLHVHITLPQGYPADRPPIFDVSTIPPWLSEDVLTRLKKDGERIWDEFGHDQVVYAYIDHLQQAAENVFGVADDNQHLQISQDHKIAILDYDIQAKRAAFERETFDCGVCLDPKKGSACYRLLGCGHVFCRQCLQDFYNNAITEGDLASVRCLAPNCSKKRAEVVIDGKRRKAKTQISPSELLQIPIEKNMVKRYVTLRHKAQLESDKNTIYCPRKWCQGAARSKKHRKPQSLDDVENSADESEDDKPAAKGYAAQRELLSVCEDCSFAFCSRCLQGWHGEFKACTPPRDSGEIAEEDKASLEYLRLHTTPCPTCAAPAQKTHGCNHMICFRCNTHFCYLCSAWLEPGNPYKHFNMEKTSCYMRLWELEGGDGAEVDHGYAGGMRAAVEAPVEIVDPEEAEAEVEPHVGPNGGEEAQVLVPVDRPVAREGPLVLRIGRAQAQAPQRVPQRPAADHNVQYAERPVGHPRRNGRFAARRDAAIARRERQAPNHNVAQEMEEAQQRWVQNFVQMALNDEEDLIDDGDEEDDVVWEIPVR
ncbi:MAG: translation termination inhibitor protein itt1 [Claussenomyces sp. TS43310]|nr:MAG: translation termination inhibitor protein itt1 [Claussenomyces sp. TS43310]